MKLLSMFYETVFLFYQAVAPENLRRNGFFTAILLAVSLGNSYVAEAGYEDDIILSAQQGDAQAQYALALLYEYGSEVMPRNKAESLKFLKLSAQQKVAGACLYLGLKYEHGNGVKQDFKKAIACYSCAASQGWPMAQYFLADFYEHGRGVSKSDLTALAWLGLAREYGYPKADADFKRIQKQLGIKDLTLLDGVQKRLMSENMTSCN